MSTEQAAGQEKKIRPVLQDWVMQLPMMQQTVLLTAIRGPDGITKYGAHKMLLRWYRRCILLSAIDGKVLTNPYDSNGGSFTGPSIHMCHKSGHCQANAEWTQPMNDIVSEYIGASDAIPHHFHMHLLHAVEILGYKHPDFAIRTWWQMIYHRFVNDLHLHPETEEELDGRLGDTREGWLERADPATTA